MRDCSEVLQRLRKAAQPADLTGMQRFGMDTRGRLGIRIPILRRMAGYLRPDHHLAMELWESGYQEARILASMVVDPLELHDSDMERWAADFTSWDVCDQVCMNAFGKSPLADRKIREWSKREDEFVRRAAFTLIACLARRDRQREDSYFAGFFPLIRSGARDPRNYVKKAVSWALRNIGKRNKTMNRAALRVAAELAAARNQTARWVGRDAVADLSKPGLRQRLKT